MISALVAKSTMVGPNMNTDSFNFAALAMTRLKQSRLIKGASCVGRLLCFVLFSALAGIRASPLVAKIVPKREMERANELVNKFAR